MGHGGTGLPSVPAPPVPDLGGLSEQMWTAQSICPSSSHTCHKELAFGPRGLHRDSTVCLPEDGLRAKGGRRPGRGSSGVWEL